MPRSLRRLLLRSTVVLAAYAAAACYESAVPLDPAPQADLDAGVPGAWHCVTPDPGDRDLTLTIALTRDRSYAVTLQEFGDEPDRYEAHASRVAGVTLVNLRDLTKSAEPWAFARYALLRPTVLQIQVLDDTAMQGVGSSPAAVRQAIERRIKDPALFADLCTCVRMTGK